VPDFPAPDDLVEVKVDAVVAGGDGLARAPDGRVVFVPGALPGETVRVTYTDQKVSFARGRIVEIVEASPDRVAPPCPKVAAGCGGCTWQHVTPAAQRRLKAMIVQDALRRIGHIDIEVGLGPELAPFGYRTTINAGVVADRAGLRHYRSHDVVAIIGCLIAHPALRPLIDHGRYPGCRSLTLRAAATTGDRMVAAEPSAAEVLVPPGTMVVGANRLGSADEGAIHETVAGVRFRISARSFFQTRIDGAEALVAMVGDIADEVLGPPGRVLVDLYGGVGLFGATLGRRASAVELVEGNESAVADAVINLAGAGVRGNVVKADVARWRPCRADVVVADPPRTGLGAAAVDRIAATEATTVALVSCDAASLGRDAALLTKHGYQLRRATLVDLFPHTPHVEVVSWFSRHPSPGATP
jgi:tRNA/tmRNA/rRNA uracil-C5-methylase (TrmA/RlmC/RlmD family)